MERAPLRLARLATEPAELLFVPSRERVLLLGLLGLRRERLARPRPNARKAPARTLARRAALRSLRVAPRPNPPRLLRDGFAQPPDPEIRHPEPPPPAREGAEHDALRLDVVEEPPLELRQSERRLLRLPRQTLAHELHLRLRLLLDELAQTGIDLERLRREAFPRGLRRVLRHERRVLLPQLRDVPARAQHLLLRGVPLRVLLDLDLRVLDR